MTDTLWHADRPDDRDSVWTGRGDVPEKAVRGRGLPAISVRLPRVTLPRLAMPALSLPALSLPALSLPALSLPGISLPVAPPASALLHRAIERTAPLRGALRGELRLPFLAFAAAFGCVEVIALVTRLAAGDAISFLLLQLALVPVALALVAVAAAAQLARARRVAALRVRQAEELAEVAASFYASNWKDRIRAR